MCVENINVFTSWALAVFLGGVRFVENTVSPVTSYETARTRRFIGLFELSCKVQFGEAQNIRTVHVICWFFAVWLGGKGCIEIPLHLSVSAVSTNDESSLYLCAVCS